MKFDSAFLSFFSESFGQWVLSRKHPSGSITNRVLATTKPSILAELFDIDN